MITVVPIATRHPRPRFVVPDGRDATLPPERRGLARDGVRLLVATPARLSHRIFRELPAVLNPGDLVVVNTSATVAAALTAERLDGMPTLIHVSGWLDSSRWIVEVRRHDNRGPDLDAAAGEVLHLPGAVSLTLDEPYPHPGTRPSRLWTAVVRPAAEAVAYLGRHGHPITYSHLAQRLPLSDHQTVYANEPGSAEMPSAGRPFTAELLVRLMAAGVSVAPLTLHAGVSSPELHEIPAPERYSVPDATARLVAHTRATGGRVVAVGTTVVRALETAAEAGLTAGSSGWTDLVLGPQRPARVVDGLVTGLHAPESTHLLLLEAIAGRDLVDNAYGSALERGYLWHEFGDSMLFLP